MESVSVINDINEAEGETGQRLPTEQSRWQARRSKWLQLWKWVQE
jgi:hypothetical protein